MDVHYQRFTYGNGATLLFSEVWGLANGRTHAGIVSRLCMTRAAARTCNEIIFCCIVVVSDESSREYAVFSITKTDENSSFLISVLISF